MIGKIIGFTQYKDKDWDCIVITDHGKRVLTYVGNAWPYDDRQHLLGMWFADEEIFYSVKADCWLASEDNFRLLPGQKTKFKILVKEKLIKLYERFFGIPVA